MTPRAYDLRANHTTHLGANLAILWCVIGLHDVWRDTVGSAVATCLMLMSADSHTHPAWHFFSIVQAAIGVAYPYRDVAAVSVALGAGVHAFLLFNSTAQKSVDSNYQHRVRINPRLSAHKPYYNASS